MTTNNFDLIEKNEISENSLGGSELALRRLYSTLPRELLQEFQIIPARVRELKEDKYRIFWTQDLPQDPESEKALGNKEWHRFHRLVFASNWQMQAFINHFQIPWSKCIVMLNAITPLPDKSVQNDQINLIYHTTPHRGLNVLIAVFDKLCETHKNIHLDLYSSFKLYGWADRDDQFKDLFEAADKHPHITNHGAVSNDEVREALLKADIFAYPSIWPETSCMCLMEAMSAGLNCVHPNYGALFETAAGWTTMYHFNEDINEHAKMFMAILDNAIRNVRNENFLMRQQSQRVFVNAFYNWESRAKQWHALLQSIVQSNEPRAITKPEHEFHYQVA